MKQPPDPAFGVTRKKPRRPLNSTLEIAVYRLYLFLLLSCLATVCSAASFDERVAIAKQVESQKEASDYFFGSFFPSVGPSVGGIMKMCLARQGASREKFTLIANVSPEGELIDIDFEPRSNNTAACFAKEVGSLKAPPPPMCECAVLPVVIDMAVKP